ncbi:MAG: MFS transporter [Chloroflexia bacterium]
MLWEFPDLGVITLGVFVVFLGLCAVWPVFTLYMQARGVSITEISLTSAAYMAASFLFQVPMGWASDKLGRKPLLLAGLATHGILSLLYLTTSDTAGFMLLRFIEGIGSAAMLPAARAHIMDTIPPARRGAAFGLLSAAFNGGMMLGPAIGGLMAGFTGFQGPFWFGAGTSLIAGIFLALKVHDRRDSQFDAEKMLPAAGGPTGGRIPWRDILPSFVVTIGWGFGGGFFTVLWNIWLHDLGASLDVIGLSYTLFALPLIFVGPWAGRLADRHSRVLLILLPSLGAAAIYFAYGFLTNIPVILALGVVEGVMIGFIGPAADSYMADVLPVAQRGRLQGMITSTNQAVGLVSALICGPLYSTGPIYLFLLLGGLHAASAITACALMLPVERRLRRRPAPAVPERLSEAEAA